MSGPEHEAASSILGTVEEAWDSTKHEADRLMSAASDTAGKAWGDVTAFVQRYPFVAFGAGVALGCLLACATSKSSSMTRDMSQSSA